MPESKNILHSNSRILLVLFCTLLMFFMRYFVFPTESWYLESDKTFEGIIAKLEVGDGYVSFLLKGKELLRATYFTKEEVSLSVGTKVKVEGDLTEIKEQTIPNLYSWKKHYRSLGCFYDLEVKRIEVVGKEIGLQGFLRSQMENRKDVGAYLKSMLLKDNGDMKDSVMETYQINNLLHVLSVSGMHLGLLQQVFRKKKRWYFLSLFLCFCLLGSSVSFLRVLFLQLLSSYNKKRRRYSLFQLWCISSCLLLWINPYFIDQIGFWYTTLISGVLIWSRVYLEQERKKVKQLWMVSWLAFLSSLPITVWFFYEANLLSVVCNFLLVPVYTYLLFPLLLLTLFLPFMDGFTGVVIQLFESVSMKASDFTFFCLLKGRPTGIEMIILITLLAFLLWFLLKKRAGRAILVFVFLIIWFIYPLPKEDKVVFLDVGQGDSTYIYSQGKAALLDTGEKRGKELLSYLKSQGLQSLEYLILSHGDQDHMKNAKDIINKIKIQKIIYNPGELSTLEQETLKLATQKGITLEMCTEGKEYLLGDFSLFSLTQEGMDENENSCVFYMANSYRSFVLTGDMTESSEKKIKEKYTLSQVDYLKVAHHGSKTSTSNEWLTWLQPSLSVISVGAKNRYQHPSKIVIERFKSNKLNYMTTSIYGSIEVYPKKKDTVWIYPPYNTLGR